MAGMIQQRAAKLTERIEILRKSETVFETGAVSSVWNGVSRDWGSFEEIPAELVEQEWTQDSADPGQVDADRLVFRIRFFEDLKSTDRVRHNYVDYKIERVRVLGRKRVLELHVSRLPISETSEPTEWTELET